MSLVIALSGFKQSGKDTVANYLIREHGFKRVSFADPLKDLVSDFFDISRQSLDLSNEKEKPILTRPVPATDDFTKMISHFMVREFRTADGFPPDPAHVKEHKGVLQTFINGWENLYHTPRSLAILMGSSMRSGDPGFWVNRAIDSIDSFFLDRDVVISDLRYKSEVSQLREAFGKNLVTIRVNRFDSSPSTDPSELDLVGFEHDLTVENKGTLKELFSKIDDFVERL